MGTILFWRPLVYLAKPRSITMQSFRYIDPLCTNHPWRQYECKQSQRKPRPLCHSSRPLSCTNQSKTVLIYSLKQTILPGLGLEAWAKDYFLPVANHSATCLLEYLIGLNLPIKSHALELRGEVAVFGVVLCIQFTKD